MLHIQNCLVRFGSSAVVPERECKHGAVPSGQLSTVLLWLNWSRCTLRDKRRQKPLEPPMRHKFVLRTLCDHGPRFAINFPNSITVSYFPITNSVMFFSIYLAMYWCDLNEFTLFSSIFPYTHCLIFSFVDHDFIRVYFAQENSTGS